MNETSTVFVGNLPWSISKEELYTIMVTAGPVITCEIQRHDRSTRSKGWALVKYADYSTALAAVSALDGVEISTRKLHVRLDRTAVDDTVNGYVVFLGNIPWNFTDEHVSELFQPYNAHDTHVVRNMAGRSRGFALSTFIDEENALRAISEIHGTYVGGRAIECRMNRENASESYATSIRNSVTVRGISELVDADALKTHFSVAGEITSVKIQHLQDEYKAIIEFSNRKQCTDATALNDSVLLGCTLSVKLNRK